MNLTAQQIYDTVALHLLTQGRQSLLLEGPTSDRNICAYRGADGSKCAAGVLIEDQYYRRDLEGKRVIVAIVRVALGCSGVNMDDSAIQNLVLTLQGCHDRSEVLDWPEHLRHIAAAYGLTAKVVDTWLLSKH